jgi:hypothetical protein
VLNLIDEYTRESLLVRAERRWSSAKVISALADVMVMKGVPEHLRSDNKPEFVAKDLRKWIAKTGANPQPRASLKAKSSKPHRTSEFQAVRVTLCAAQETVLSDEQLCCRKSPDFNNTPMKWPSCATTWHKTLFCSATHRSVFDPQPEDLRVRANEE